MLAPEKGSDKIGVKANIKQNEVEVFNKGTMKLLYKIDLTGLQGWSLKDEKEALDLILEYMGIFSMHPW